MLGLLGAGLISRMPATAEPNLQMADHHTTSGSTSGSVSSKTIVDVASGSDSFKTLVQALKAADLTSTLSGNGPYTVFAPTDDAFSALPEGALEFLLKPENKGLLTQVLTYHVVSGEVMSNELSPGEVKTLNGGLSVGTYQGKPVINNASITQADIQASNGVIHQVNRVLIPEPLQQKLAEQLGVNTLYQ